MMDDPNQNVGFMKEGRPSSGTPSRIRVIKRSFDREGDGRSAVDCKSRKRRQKRPAQGRQVLGGDVTLQRGEWERQGNSRKKSCGEAGVL